MPTFKQQSALEKLVENGGNATQAMREAGYSEATANNPSNLTESKGFKELLKASGLDESTVISALVEDIKNKPQNRVRELTLASDILGMKKRGSESQDRRELPAPIYGGISISEVIAKKNRNINPEDKLRNRVERT
jgi:hypothetical protein